ncbi:MAG: MFS transporter [Phycisphaerae bacterium]|nr:thiamine pyrophosphate-dependent enzyme [Phycisphaerae bacterium]NUQ46220.1 MFS transporter [Phycisphaerae bacterium]
MTFNRARAIDEQFVGFLREAGATGDPRARIAAEPKASHYLFDAAVRSGATLNGRLLIELFDAQMTCRHLDLIARVLRGRDAGYYTIGSAGHEGNVVLGAAVRHTDPSFVHYRSGALMVQRSRQVPGIDAIRDTLLSQAAAAADPIAGGRHKVWGSAPLWVPPQTSTIASHLPKSVGAAIAIERARRLKLPLPVPNDSIVMCTFGDASVNHAAAQTAFNATSWTVFQNIPVPILFVCEDNGIGISVHTPPGWVRERMSRQPGFGYIPADGLDLVDAYEAAIEAVAICRTRRRPVFLHLRTIRMLGHAGSDVETEYHTLDEIAAVEKNDPLLRTARLVMDAGLMTADEILARYEEIRQIVAATAEEVVPLPKLRTAVEVMSPLAPYHPEAVQIEAARPAGGAETDAARGAPPPLRGPRHMAVLINRALHEALEKYPEAAIFGEDVARKGGVYHVTTGLWERFGPGRVFNTLLDETTILGLAIGAAHLGMLPIPEIQYLAYYHNAEDQIRGEACSLQYFSKGQFRNPMVVRIAGLAYQRGFGGHFHNDNSVAALRDIPGLILCAPARGDDAVRMLRTCLALARVDGRVVVFLEPIALYMTKDLHAEGDGGWQFDYPPQGEAISPGEGGVHDAEARDLTIVTYANGLYMSLRAAKTLADRHGVRARVLDLRWLNPLNHEWVAQHARDTGRVLVVDECRRDGGLGEAIVAGIVERCGGDVDVSLLAADDTYVPLGPAMRVVMPSEETIVERAVALARPADAHRAATPPKPVRV